MLQVALQRWLQTWLVAVLAWWLHSPRLLFLLLFFSCPIHLAVNAQESCSRGRAEIEIRYRNCAPRVVLVFACSGNCNSYSQPNPNQPEHLERSCRCCRELGRLRARVRLRCPARDDHRRNQFVFFRISIPTRCVCRPCSG